MSDERQKRLAEQLRRNLQRRKAQARTRKVVGAEVRDERDRPHEEESERERDRAAE